jgi:hypothetical protein
MLRNLTFSSIISFNILLNQFDLGQKWIVESGKWKVERAIIGEDLLRALKFFVISLNPN